MVNRMSFASLVESYSVPIIITKPAEGEGGSYVNGEWIPLKQEPYNDEGAIIPYTNQEMYQSGGVITTKDRQLAYVGELPIATKIEDVEGKTTYEITNVSPFAEHYADTSLYQMKEVGIFERSV